MRQRRPSPEIFCIHGIFGELSSPPSSTWGSGIGFGLLSLDARPTSTAKSVVPESSHPRTHTYGFP